IEAGKLELEKIEFDPRAAVDDVLDLLAESARRKGIELACWFEPNVPNHVVGDPGRLRQILINLVGNAIKFTPQGEVFITVALEPSNAADCTSLRLEVRDSGPGLSEEAQARLFQPFSQVDTSTTRRHGG